jgi:two-component system OmpR family response regulator
MPTARQLRRRPQVLLIENEQHAAEEIGAALDQLGYCVDHARTFAEGLEAARAGAEIIILDRPSQGADGLAVIETLRREGARTPVLVISELCSVEERIRGLAAGGDDYLVKPFAMAELAARVEALARRLDDLRATKLRADTIEMDLIERTVTRADAVIELMPREFRLLEYFLRRPRRVVTRAMLLESVWRYRSAVETNVVDVHIGALRRKIDIPGQPSIIRNIRGVGFVLDAQ